MTILSSSSSSFGEASKTVNLFFSTLKLRKQLKKDLKSQNDLGKIFSKITFCFIPDENFFGIRHPFIGHDRINKNQLKIQLKKKDQVK